MFCQWTLFLNGEAGGSWQRGREIIRDDLIHCSCYRAGKRVSEAEATPAVSHCNMHRSWEQNSGPVTVRPRSFCETWLPHEIEWQQAIEVWPVVNPQSPDVLTVLLAPSTLDQEEEEGFGDRLSALESLVTQALHSLWAPLSHQCQMMSPKVRHDKVEYRIRNRTYAKAH